MKVTLGSRINGMGHFLTMKSFFGKETNMTNSTDATLTGRESSTRTLIRSSYSQDVEMGQLNNGIRVDREMTSTSS